MDDAKRNAMSLQVLTIRTEQEDLDLLSFSPLTSAPSQKTSAEGLPLKVVYRDAVVGIRYLHSRENNVPVYRRMQISFQSTQEASEFIEIIKPICPCKLNPVATGVLPTPRTQMQHTDQQGLSIQASIVTRASPTLQTKASANIPAFVRPDPPVLVAMPQRITAPSMPVAPRSSSPTVTSKQASDSSFHISSDDTNGLRPSTSNDMTLPLHQKENLVSPHTTQIPSSSVPSSSATSGDLYQSRPHPLVAALNSSTPIYEMSNGALEQLIGEIVHEDGFVQLLERMSQLLTVRTLLDS
ncbi:hypothetical protein D9613_000477 [Agrocybe pediades]|uniref:Uncharacterized protein n=1 Tax=Agrocybe pediades TaxID=84607 RepID=A0A8H4VUL3_9AGAR|nr:hypothetical protein D9613_000477 [Agrocybe pediades]